MIAKGIIQQPPREAAPRTAEVTADLVFSLGRPESGHATARTCGHDRPTAATRYAEVRSTIKPGRATPKWLVRSLPAGLWSGRSRRYAPAKLRTSVKALAPKVPYAPSGTSPGRSGPFGAVRLTWDAAEWSLQGNAVLRSGIADRRHPCGGASSVGRALLVPAAGRGSAQAAVLTRSPYLR